MDETRAAAKEVEISEATMEVLDEERGEFNRMRRCFATSILESWDSEDASWFVTKPPCAEGLLKTIKDDLSRLIKAVKAKLWGDPEFGSLMGSERYQRILKSERVIPSALRSSLNLR
ncbi:MAG: hypothetical protein IKQ60_05815 [Candidatus Methanomethylophilaceae archaeon]|nr:hypothetical protein [Candidatus Methanomethylophilaceae archaeon]